MEIAQQENNGVVCLKFTGRLDADSAPAAEASVKGLMQQGKSRLLFDLSELDYISSAGLRVILLTVKGVQSQKGKVVLSALRPYVREVFDVSNFSSIIPITDTVAAGWQQF
ncbi:MAG: STAS domain-containing protein [Desulfobacterales bacterium]|jgi:anti-anti-sigma factor|nr:STAS domain-containing protein [Desulfobacterales bacterium]MCU0584978.1 STAS domain-containing protein [Desulfobacterales bacterium]